MSYFPFLAYFPEQLRNSAKPHRTRMLHRGGSLHVETPLRRLWRLERAKHCTMKMQGVYWCGRKGVGWCQRHHVVDSSRMPQMCGIPLGGVIQRHKCSHCFRAAVRVGVFSLLSVVKRYVHTSAPSRRLHLPLSNVPTNALKSSSFSATDWTLHSFTTPERDEHK
jgi:hypothetical protein